MLFASGGVKGGHIHGKADRIGAHPAENPVTPHDFVGTIHHLLGIPKDTEVPDQLGRRIHVVGKGRVIEGVMA